MNAQERLDFYKNIHTSESERKEKIEQALGMPITIIFGLSALLYLLLSEFDFKYSSPLNWAFLPLLACTAFSLFVTIVCAIFAYALIGFYRAEPFANNLEQYRVDTENYFKQTSPATWQSDAENDFIDYLINLYVSQASDNTQRNDQRSTWIERVKFGLIISLFFAIISLIPFVINFLNKPDKVYKVSIDSLPKLLHPQTLKIQNNVQRVRRECSATFATHTLTCTIKACSTQRKIDSRRP